MGMDVYGQKPTAPEGEYFRRNVWCWHPLAEVCQSIAPDACAPCTHWHSNDGDGLDATHAGLLADQLDEVLQSGAVAKYLAIAKASFINSRRIPAAYKFAYSCMMEDVAEFAAFLRASGGFEIR